MAMTKQLWSISGLAVELGKDRRTIAKALSSVAADGHIAGEKAWHMTTALTALSGERRTPDPTQENNDIVLTLLDRLDHWPQLHSSELSSLTLSVSEFADLARQTPENILDCLRAGMPFVEEGDWRTGKGFKLRLHWAMEWQVYLIGCAFNMGRQDILARFGLSTSRI